jgi:hypothetical protein
VRYANCPALAGRARDQNRHANATDCRYFDRRTAFDAQGRTALPLQVFGKGLSGARFTATVKHRPRTVYQIAQQVRADVPVESVVLEFVLETAKAFVAGNVAIASL